MPQMLLLLLLALFTFGSGLCATMSFLQLFHGGGAFDAFVGAITGVISLAGAFALYNKLRVDPPDDPA